MHLYQIWLLPDRSGHTPSYEQRTFDEAGRRNQFQLVAAPDGADEDGKPLSIHQDARIFLADIESGRTLMHELEPARHGWLQVLRGSVGLNGEELSAGDGVAISDEPSITLNSPDYGEIMLFDMA